jgi:hypothetical protein
MSEITDAVERAIKKHGSLRRAAKALGFAPAHLCRIRLGKLTSVAPETLARLGLKRTTYITRR